MPKHVHDRLHSRTAFGEFAVAPDAPLSDLATFYEMQVPPKLVGLTVAEAFSARYGNRLHTGSRLTLANYAELVARVVEDGQVLEAVHYTALNLVVFDHDTYDVDGNLDAAIRQAIAATEPDAWSLEA